MSHHSPNVLHLVPQLFGPGGVWGGAERYALELSRAMSVRTPTRLVGFGPSAGSRREGELEIVTLRNQLPGPRFAVSPASLALWPHLRWADVIHCHQIYAMATSLALLYGRVWRTPVFVTDHAGGGLSLHSYFNLDAWFAGRLWVSAFSRGSRPPLPGDRVIFAGVDEHRFCPAEAAARGHEQSAPLLPSSEAQQANNGSGPANSGEPPAPPPGVRPVLFVGRLLPIKGVDLLIRAVDAHTPVVILGPAYDAGYAAALRQLAQGKQVSFLPPVDGEALVAAYRNALCVVLPGTEMLALAVLEAMACATPVICATSSGMPEVIEDGISGLVFPAGDARALGEKIAWLGQHPEAARAMGQAARQRVNHDLTWTAVADRCFQAYCLASSHPPE